MCIDRLRYELQLMGKRVILVPLLIMLGCSLFAILLHLLKEDPARFLSSGLEMMLPLAAGVIVGTVANQDPALELQLTMPRTYHFTVVRRIALIGGWTVCIAFLSSLLIAILKLGFLPQQLQSWPTVIGFLTNQLTWLAPLFWFVAVGLCIALLTRSSVASGGLLAALWLAETLFKDLMIPTTWLRPIFLFPTTLTPSIDFWLPNRLEILATGIVLLFLDWLLLQNTEGLLKGSSEE